MNERQRPGPVDSRELNIDIFQILSVLWKNIAILILAAAIAGSAAFGYTYFFISPKYSATTTFFANSNSFSVGSTSLSITSSEISASRNLVGTYMMILQSRTTLNEVAAAAELPYDYRQLSGMLSAEQVEDTSAFNVTAVSSDPAEAEKIANTVAEVLPARIAEIVDGSSIRVVDYAVIPTARSSPNYTLNTLAGAVAGAAICAVILVGINLIWTQKYSEIRSTDDLKTLFPELPVLALIPDMRSGEKKGYYYSDYYSSGEKSKNKTNRKEAK